MGLYHQLLACQRPTCLTARSLSHGSRLVLHFDSIPPTVPMSSRPSKRGVTWLRKQCDASSIGCATGRSKKSWWEWSIQRCWTRSGWNNLLGRLRTRNAGRSDAGASGRSGDAISRSSCRPVARPASFRAAPGSAAANARRIDAGLARFVVEPGERLEVGSLRD